MPSISRTLLGCLLLVIGIFAGSLCFLWIRVLYLRYINDFSGNMGPEVVVVMSPFFAGIIAVYALLLHLRLEHWLRFDSHWAWFLAGISYSTLTLGLISPWLLIVPLVVNPVSLKIGCNLLSSLSQKVG